MFNVLGVVIANIQVLKVAPFALIPEPVALGTLLFSTTFLASDILTEHHGKESAKVGIKLSFFAQIFTTVVMLITLMYPSTGGVTGHDTDKLLRDDIQTAMYTLFSPSFRILVASLIAFYVSQIFDISVFNYIKKITNDKMMWLRLNVSSLLSGLLDNILFSTLAWVILSPNPVGFETLLYTYILGTYAARVLVSLTSTPIIYLSHKFRAQNDI